MKIHRYLLMMACAATLAACTQPAAPVAPAAPESPAPEAGTDPAPSAAVVDGAPGQKPPSCMIAGEFNLLGRTIRSRDCVQPTGASTQAEMTQICEGLANTSAQMGGKAGQITYLDACPSPAQGSCRQLFGRAFDGYYYERSAEDLANLPDSCAQGGGVWVPG